MLLRFFYVFKFYGIPIIVAHPWKHKENIKYNIKPSITMRKLLILTLMLIVSSATMTAQTAKEIIKERKALTKASKSELNAKASKAAPFLWLRLTERCRTKTKRCLCA